MYQANEKRYETMKYHRCGASGLMFAGVVSGFMGIISGIPVFMRI